MTRRALPLLCVSLLACAVARSGSPCSEAGNEICERACSCGGDSACTISTGPPDFVTLTFASKKNCVGLVVDLGCTGDTSGIDFDGCSAALDEAACIETGTPGEMAVQSPPECNAQPDAGP
jgi:hypothetical protein